MKKMIILTSLVLLMSCVPPADVAVQKGMQSGNIRIGSSREEVAAAVGGYPSESCIKKKITEEGTLEMWDLATTYCAANRAASYALIFRDGRLVEIRQVTNITTDLQFW